jgi:uncharacterized membrane protein
VWIGGLFFQAVILVPALQKSSEHGERFSLLVQLEARFRPLAWLSLVILVVTGLIQMVMNPNYEGLLGVANTWSSAILAKHVAFGGMLLIAAFQTWVLQPQIRRVLILRARGMARQETGQVTARLERLSRLNLVLGLIVLGFTALARASL